MNCSYAGYETALFSIYLKYVVEKGDLLIIEEPEAHLHPENQRILVKYIVRAVNKGLKVMLTTHSDYVIEQFNNFVRLASIDSERLDVCIIYCIIYNVKISYSTIILKN